MFQVETFEEMLQKIDDKDFILKVIQAEVILTKTDIIDTDLEKKGNYVKRLAEETSHNGINKEHYDYAVELYEYEQEKLVKGLGGCNPKFPKRINSNGIHSGNKDE